MRKRRSSPASDRSGGDDRFAPHVVKANFSNCHLEMIRSSFSIYLLEESGRLAERELESPEKRRFANARVKEQRNEKCWCIVYGRKQVSG
jgi:hypothetical protein